MGKFTDLKKAYQTGKKEVIKEYDTRKKPETQDCFRRNKAFIPKIVENLLKEFKRMNTPISRTDKWSLEVNVDRQIENACMKDPNYVIDKKDWGIDK